MSLQEALASIPRVAFVDAPTPIQRLARIESALGEASRGIRLFAKRDDLMALGGGGNKLRKLEYLMGDARANGCDTIIATGGIQSNFTRVVGAACAREGMACELVLAPLVPGTDADYDRNGNTVLNALFGATVHTLGQGQSAAEFAKQRVEDLRAQGRTPYLTPSGGSNAVSAVAYARCALELDRQFAELGVDNAIVVTPNGSNGTHAGLLAGFRALDRAPSRLRAFSVMAPAPDAMRSTLAMANEGLERLGLNERLALDDVQVSESQRGRGYGLTTEAMVAAIRLMASHEGLLLDPVYSGKAFAGLIEDVRAGRYPPGSDIVFLMTGGSPALYAYPSTFAQNGVRP
jgi:L-cysteate sulfo-lyase